mmetsp:Transcript_4251/g.6333  ORF Transcript_4251/g.6333 Transcript_4251/m.6333 type:complete len:440 (+) Transcript_4251:58-1377(+)
MAGPTQSFSISDVIPTFQKSKRRVVDLMEADSENEDGNLAITTYSPSEDDSDVVLIQSSDDNEELDKVNSVIDLTKSDSVEEEFQGKYGKKDDEKDEKQNVEVNKETKLLHSNHGKDNNDILRNAEDALAGLRGSHFRGGEIHRYFFSDMRCYRCNKIGHMAAQCTEDSTFCAICGEYGHDGMEGRKQCPNMPCGRCFKIHGSKMCKIRFSSRREMLQKSSICYRCGAVGHSVAECKAICDMSSIFCMVCGKTGHVNCMEEEKTRKASGFTSENLPCFNCGGPTHEIKDCGWDLEMSVDLYRFAAPQIRGRKTCFRCGKEGHISKDCPLRTMPKCFVCGSTEHILKDCPRRRQRGKPSDNFGRRRGKQERSYKEWPRHLGNDWKGNRRKNGNSESNSKKGKKRKRKKSINDKKNGSGSKKKKRDDKKARIRKRKGSQQK